MSYICIASITYLLSTITTTHNSKIWAKYSKVLTVGNIKLTLLG